MLNELENNYNEEEEYIDNNFYNIENERDYDDLINVFNKDNLNENKNIKVFCRFRPPNENELSYSTNNCLILLSPQKLIFTQEKNLEIKKEYIFDGLFDLNTQKEIFYNKTCKPIISNFLKGYNGCIMCYGETGTGKTYTIKEIIPSIISQIFKYIYESDIEDELFKIEVSSFEIYKEKINDLIEVNNKNLNLIQGEINNITNINVSSQEQMTSILNEVLNIRNIKELQNHDSKSHFIIKINLSHYSKQKNCLIISKLFLVDLGGSESLSKNKDENIEEQKLINKSLIALSIIVNNFNINNKNNYIPYRDSKLTQIIRESLGGNCYTNIILTCSKHEKSALETRNTLMFGEKAKNIVNNPIINIQNDFNKENKDNIYLSEIKEEENENIYESINNNNDNKNIIDKEKNFLKIQIKQLKEIIEQDKIYIEQINERNMVLESEKKNLMEEFENLIKEKNEENKKDTINSEYIENNINDFHQLLNEKDIREKELKEEINNLKLLLEKNKIEISEAINKKNNEILKIKEEQSNQIQTFQELMDCLEQASNQIQSKDKKIEELLNNNNNKEYEDEKTRLEEIIKQRENMIIVINEEKNNLIKKKTEYDNRINGMTKLINKMKEELDKKNINEINKQNEITIILNENNVLKNKIVSLENNINNINKTKNELEQLINKKEEEFNQKYILLKNESESKINEIKNEIDIKNKIGIELHNLKIKYQNLLKSNEQQKLKEKNIINNFQEKIKTSENEINELNNKIISIQNDNKNNIEQLKSEIYSKEKLLQENKYIYENELKEINSYKILINKLKKENASLNNIIIDTKAKMENQENNTKNNYNKLNNLEQKLEAKEYIINDYKAKYEQILKENILNKKTIKDLEENNKIILKNFDILKAELNKYESESNEKEEKNEEIINISLIKEKEEYLKEIEKYKDIIKQKEDKINELNNKINDDKISIDKILILQKEISELKVENNKMYNIIKEYEKEKENKEENNKKESVVYLINKDMNKEKIKNAYRTLTQENEHLKNNIIKLKQYYH